MPNFSLPASMNLLSKTPGILEVLLDGLPASWIANNEGAATWSPFDILGHLIQGEKTDWIPRTKIILSNQPDKTFPPFDRFAQLEASKGKTIDDLLLAFRTLRNQNLEIVKALELNEDKLSQIGYTLNLVW